MKARILTRVVAQVAAGDASEGLDEEVSCLRSIRV